MPSILIVNPNSSQSITNSLKELVSPPPGWTLAFFTGPPSSPPSIDDEETDTLSEKACLPLLQIQAEDHDTVLIACYSDHSLISSLREIFPDKPIIGIFEASIVQALLLGKKFGIVTTGKPWEALLTDAVHKLGGYQRNPARFAGVVSTGLGVLELHDAEPSEVSRRIGEAAKSLVEDAGADVICLGCAGMSGMEEAIRNGVPGHNIQVVDGVQAGVKILANLVPQIERMMEHEDHDSP